jgi:hypothetical protein
MVTFNKLFVTALTVLVLSVGLIRYIQAENSSSVTSLIPSPSPLPPQSPTPTPIAEPKTQSPIPMSSPSPVSILKQGSPSPSPTPLVFTNQGQDSLQSWYYPNASSQSSSPGEANLTSTDDSQTITTWYKNKIQGQQMNVTSFIQTNTNNNVLNSLVAANSQQEIRIEIKKSSQENITHISIKLK